MCAGRVAMSSGCAVHAGRRQLFGAGFRLAALSLVVALSAAGCRSDGSTTTDTAEVGGFVRVTEPSPAEPSRSSGPTVLIISGDLGEGGTGEDVSFDLPTLERLGLMRATVREPFEKIDITFTGVQLSDVLDAAHVSDDATSIHLSAMDDYQVDLDIDDLRAGGVMLATQQDGQAIPVDHGGPIRVVFGKGVEAGANPDQWIWNILTMSVT